MRTLRGGGGAGCPDPPPSPEKSKKDIGFLINTGPDPLKNYKATKPAFKVGPSLPARETLFKQCILCRWIDAATPGNLKKEVRKTDLRCSAHISQVAMTAATECGVDILPHPPYSHDMAPSDFYLFPKLKSHLRGTQYESNEGFIKAIN